MSFDFSISKLRNELYVINQKTEKNLFSIHGFDIDVDFTKMPNNELKDFIINNFQDAINDLI